MLFKKTASTPPTTPPTSPTKFKGMKGGDKDIGSPQGVVHEVHVDKTFHWSGKHMKDPESTFDLLEVLGAGGFGVVHKARFKESQQVFAVKIVRGNRDTIEKEIKMLQEVRGDNIVQYYGCIHDITKGVTWIIMDYCEPGSIRDLIETIQMPLSEEQAAYVCLAALKGLVVLHNSKKIVHRDIKCANILLTSEGTVKLADFGLSEKIEPTNLDGVGGIAGTKLWMAPEVYKSRHYDFKCDIWSLGISCIEMVDGNPPILMNAAPKLKDPASRSPLILDFVARCCTVDPQQRPSAVELLQHGFLQQITSHEPLKTLIHAQGLLKQQERRLLKGYTSANSTNKSQPSKASLLSSVRFPKKAVTPEPTCSSSPPASSSSSSSSTSTSAYRTAENHSYDSYASVQYNSVPEDKPIPTPKANPLPSSSLKPRELFPQAPTSPILSIGSTGSPVVISDPLIPVPEVNLTSEVSSFYVKSNPLPLSPNILSQEISTSYNLLQEMKTENYKWQERITEDITQLRTLLNMLYVENSNLRSLMSNNGSMFMPNDTSSRKTG